MAMITLPMDLDDADTIVAGARTEREGAPTRPMVRQSRATTAPVKTIERMQPSSERVSRASVDVNVGGETIPHAHDQPPKQVRRKQPASRSFQAAPAQGIFRSGLIKVMEGMLWVLGRGAGRGKGASAASGARDKTRGGSVTRLLTPQMLTEQGLAQLLSQLGMRHDAASMKVFTISGEQQQFAVLITLPEHGPAEWALLPSLAHNIRRTLHARLGVNVISIHWAVAGAARAAAQVLPGVPGAPAPDWPERLRRARAEDRASASVAAGPVGARSANMAPAKAAA